MHAVGAVHDTLANSTGLPPGEPGVSSAIHFVPFHLLARTIALRSFGKVVPTAVHAVGDLHETPWNIVSTGAADLGVVSIAHSLPLHLSGSR